LARAGGDTLRQLPGPAAIQEINKGSFLWVPPVELRGGDGTEVQAVDVGGVDQFAVEVIVARDGRGDQRGADRGQHFFLRAVDYGDGREQVFFVGARTLGGVAVKHRRSQIGMRFAINQPRPIIGGGV